MRLLRSASLLATCFLCIIACLSMTMDAHALSLGSIRETAPDQGPYKKESTPLQFALDCLLHSVDMVEEIETESKVDAADDATSPPPPLTRPPETILGNHQSTSRILRRWILYCSMQVDC